MTKQTLFMLLGDVEFEIRLTSLALLGRLAQLNSAHTLAPLRNVLKQLVLALTFSRDIVVKHQSTAMLCTFLKTPALQTLVHPYVRQMIEILPLKVRLDGWMGCCCCCCCCCCFSHQPFSSIY